MERLVQGAEIQCRINDLDVMLSATVMHPEWFGDVAAARNWLEDEIAQLEAEQLVLLQENENSRLAGRLDSENCKNVIWPMVPQWMGPSKGAGA